MDIKKQEIDLKKMRKQVACAQNQNFSGVLKVEFFEGKAKKIKREEIIEKL